MRIENYLGFPTGLTGSELTERAVLQANKFGAVLSIPAPVTSLTFNSGYSVLSLDDGQTVVAKCLLVATGADYRRLDVEGCARFEGSGVFYAATPNEVQQCRGARVAVVGGGNSAGQAAVFLAGQASQVYLLVRSDNLYKQMSTYLARRIERTPNIEVLLNTSVQRMVGNGQLSSTEIVNRKTGDTRERSRLRPSSASSARCHAPTGCRRTSKPTSAALSERGRLSIDSRMARRAASHFCSRPVVAACSPRVTFAPPRSSVSRQPSARDRWRFSSCMNI